jgi:membrane protein implicated in regulation of membrane protease activity
VLAEGEEEKPIRHSAPLLSKVRFGAGVLSMLSFIAFMAVLLYILGHLYLAAGFVAIGTILVGVKSMEIIQLGRSEQRQLIGRKCLVINGVEKGKVGVARVYDRKGQLDPELWSAESDYSISAGQEAEVVGIRTIVLIIKPRREESICSHTYRPNLANA